jgi:hypothetical protein
MRRVMRATVLAVMSVSAVALVGCDEETGPVRDHIEVRNDSSTEAQVRVKMWQKDFKAVTSGKSERLEFDAQSKTLQVEAKSRKQWDDCWVTMQVGQTLVVFDDGEQIGCRAE